MNDSALLAGAVANNAAWCGAVCRAHGIDTAISTRLWSSPVRTPPLYPDAVTLVAGCDPAEVLASIDAVSPGASVKDSYHDVDLADHGFAVVLRGSWLALEPVPSAPRGAAVSTAPALAWRRVNDRAAFAHWERAWRGANGPAGVLDAQLVADPSIEVWAGCAGASVVAGAVFNDAAGLIGVSNVFAPHDRLDATWAEVVALVRDNHPTRTAVGWEPRPDPEASVPAAGSAGFRSIGALRVWIRDRHHDECGATT